MKRFLEAITFLRRNISARSVRTIRWKLVAICLAIMLPVLAMGFCLMGVLIGPLLRAPDWVTYFLGTTLVIGWILQNAKTRRA